MDERYLAFLASQTDFYDIPGVSVEDNHESEDLASSTRSPGDDLGFVDWSVGTRGPWRLYQPPGARLPATGWKIHVSTTPERAYAVVNLVVQICLDRKIACKHLRSQHLVATSQAKYADRHSAGKVITIYPPNDTTAQAFAALLNTRLADEPGAAIPGEVRAGTAPVFLRYGPFIARTWTDTGSGPLRLEANAAAASDADAPGRPQPDTHEPPPFVQALMEHARRTAADHQLPITDVQLLHRTNAGAVYRAVDLQGRRVILKEARHHSGFDIGGADAVTRLRHEHSVLSRLAGMGVAPTPYDYLTVGTSDFLSMEDLGPLSLTGYLASQHPLIQGSGGDMRPTYETEVRRFMAQLRALTLCCHAQGVVHGDIHPGNLVITANGLRLIDFESAMLDGFTPTSGIAAFLSCSNPMPSVAADLESVELTKQAMINPHHALLGRQITRREEMLRVTTADIRDVTDGRHTVTMPGGADPARLRRDLLTGIDCAATPWRHDRLFPGDIRTFAEPGGGLGLLHGAAGVIGAWAAAGQPVPERWIAWLLDRLEDTPLGRGLAYGIDGVWISLVTAGAASPSTDCIQRLLDQTDAPKNSTDRGPWWAQGRAGMLLAAAVLQGPDACATDVIRAYLDSIDQDLQRPTEPANYRPGLLQGWAGVALALVRTAELLENSTRNMGSAGTSNDEAAHARHLAMAALERERRSLRVINGAALAQDGALLMPYLGYGSAAAGLAAACLTTPQARSATNAALTAAVIQTCTRRAVVEASLMHGRAGLAYVLASLSPGHPMTEVHLRRLDWYTRPPSSTPPSSAPADDDATVDRIVTHASPGPLLLLGSQALRCSADLATGSAGAIAALTPGAVTRVLHLPEALQAGNSQPIPSAPADLLAPSREQE